MFGGITAHFLRGAQVDADGGAFGSAKNSTAIVPGQLNAADARGLAVRHPRNGGGNRGGNAARAAAAAAFLRLVLRIGIIALHRVLQF